MDKKVFTIVLVGIDGERVLMVGEDHLVVERVQVDA
jgi:hypothetical protein